MPQVLLCTLCDDVRTEVGNKHTLVGVFDSFNVVDYEQPLPKFHVFAKFGIEAGGTYPFRLTVSDDAGEMRSELRGEFEARERSDASGLFEGVLNLAIAGMQIPRAGRYTVRFTIGDTSLDGCAFVARTLERSTIH